MSGVNPHEHNKENIWQGDFQFGGFDCILFRYALRCVSSVAGLTSVAITHLDVFGRGHKIPVCNEYRMKKRVSENHGQYTDKHGFVVNDLVPNFNLNLKHQESLTDLLQNAEGVSRDQFVKAGDVINHISAIAKLPAKYLSFGPKAEHKVVC
jgi:adenylosuccinate synthase